MKTVKSPRRYDSRGRREQAHRTKEAILDAAEEKFLGAGYATTTIADIAQAAGVSVETIYKAFGGKPGLVRAIYEKGLLGRGSTPAYERSEEMRARETDPRTIMREWGALAAELTSQVTPIHLLIRAAATSDEDMARLLKDSEDHRLKRMRHNARFLQSRGYPRAGMTLREVTDILWTCSSAELYELLVLKRGWSHAHYARFVAELMIKTLLPPGS